MRVVLSLKKTMVIFIDCREQVFQEISCLRFATITNSISMKVTESIGHMILLVHLLVFQKAKMFKDLK